eukprot:Sspe_Gene.82864::Locus_54326_Transcript_1_1_Confidence_1.000_Length_1571::g.82864::m.82864
MAREDRKKRLLGEIKGEIERISSRWNVTTYLSGGSYGEVCGAIDKKTGQKVAIKRVYQAKVGKEGEVVILREPFLAKRVYREIKLLSHFHHENILGLVTVLRDPPSPKPLSKVYMVMDCMDTDLSQIIRDTKAQITEDHIQYFMFQIFHGLKCLHDAKVIHRDLHPGNILLNAENDIKICDFNLAKEDSGGQTASTDYVTYRWYRAPELVMQWKNYDKKIDMWSAGCIMAELYNRKPLFPGTTFYNQLNKIIETIGTPSMDEVRHIGSQSAIQYLFRELTGISPTPWERVVRTTNNYAIELISNLLVFNPEKRYDVVQALHTDYFKYPNCLFDEEEMANMDPTEQFHFNEELNDAESICNALAIDIERIQRRFQMETQAELERNDDMLRPTNASMCDGSKYVVRTNSDYHIEDIDKLLAEEAEKDAPA